MRSPRAKTPICLFSRTSRIHDYTLLGMVSGQDRMKTAFRRKKSHAGDGEDVNGDGRVDAKDKDVD